MITDQFSLNKNISASCLHFCNFADILIQSDLQWGKKVFSQPPIVQVLPLKKMRPVIFIIGTLQLWQTKREKKSRKSHCRIFYEFICKLWWKISIWSPTNKQDIWLSQTCNFFFKRLLCPPLVISIKDTCPQPHSHTPNSTMAKTKELSKDTRNKISCTIGGWLNTCFAPLYILLSSILVLTTDLPFK